MLGMDVQELGRDGLHDLKVHRAVIDERAGTPGPGDHPAHQDTAAIRVYLILIQDPEGKTVFNRNDEFSLNHTIVPFPPDHGGISLRAQEHG